MLAIITFHDIVLYDISLNFVSLLNPCAESSLESLSNTIFVEIFFHPLIQKEAKDIQYIAFGRT